jgi:hypothetical protein
MGLPMKCSAVAICCVIFANHLHAADLFVNAVEVLGYGIIEAHTSQPAMARSRESILVDGVEHIRFVKQTSEIPAQLGTEFGVQYRVNTTPKGSLLKIHTVVVFPEGGLTDDKGRVYEKSTESFNITIGEKSFYGFGFDEPWEMVPGKWVIQIWHKQSRLMERSFNVRLPEDIQ